MVYTSSLNVPVKKALGNQVMQSNLNKICDQMGLDPDTTNMDVVILGPKDLLGPKAQKVQKAVSGKHPDVCVIYIYNKDAEASLLDCDYKHQCKKITTNEINDIFSQAVGDHKLRQGKGRVTSADFDVQDNDVKEGTLKDIEMPEVPEVPEEEAPDVQAFDFNKAPAPEPLPVPEVEEPVIEPELAPLDTAAPFVAPQEVVPEPVPVEKVETFLAGVNSFEDWGLLKEHLHKDSIVKNLIAENSEYVGLINTLDVLDQRIQTVFRDEQLTADQKFDKIKEIGLERSVVRATTNSLQVEKVISIVTTIILAAKRTVEEKVQNLDVALYKVTTDKSKLADTRYIDKAIEERTKVQLELLNISRGIVDLYKSVDELITEEIADLDAKLPSGNAYINNMVKPIGTQIFTPMNTAALANKLMKCLQENNLVASQLEDMINAVIEQLFVLCEKDEEIIRYQQNMINLLKANRVEDVIITTSLLKQSMRIYTGADNTGRASTAITWSGILSRRSNTVLIDFTGRAKFYEYGITPITLNDFMNERIERQFVCVDAGRILAPDELQEVIQEVKSRLNYYAYVNVIVAPEDINGLQMLAEEAKVIHYITNCSTSSVALIKELNQKCKLQNIARKLICIDAPVAPQMIVDACGIDITNTMLVDIPAIPAIRACALRHDRPYEYSDVVRIFEEAFR